MKITVAKPAPIEYSIPAAPPAGKKAAGLFAAYFAVCYFILLIEKAPAGRGFFSERRFQMTKRIVIALGGNALGKNLEEQYVAVRQTSQAIADLIEAGHQVVIAHGNGPQVGMIQNAMAALERAEPGRYGFCPLPTCGAMSQGYIGFDLQNALAEVLAERGISKPVTTLITQVEVDPQDPAFRNPTKPIGSFMTEGEAMALKAKGVDVMEDAGRGYRQVVASPKPIGIVELPAAKALMEAGQIVITCGGGGIPVVREGKSYKGAAAVIDKDFAAELLAESVEADLLIILTAVEKVAIGFRQPHEKWLDTLTPAEAEGYIAAGEFAPGSMLPKVEAALRFAKSAPGRTALITLLEKAKEGIEGKTGTRVVAE